MGRIKSIFATTDVIIGIVAFLSVSTLFVVNAATLNGSMYGSAGSEIRLLGMEARAQHSVLLIERLGLNLTGAEQVLDYDVGGGNYSLAPFNQSATSYRYGSSFYRILAVDGNAYYLEVNLNGSTA